jgi:hypothetical protein
MRAKRPHSRRLALPDAAAKVRRPSSAGMAALVALALAGCATPGAGDPRDPLEPLNRGIYEVNEAVDRAVIRPVAEFYTAVLPDPARTGVSNFFGNLYDYWNAINNLLQGKVGAAMSDVGRIALNTTVGLHGFVDETGTLTSGRPTLQEIDAQGTWRATRIAAPGALRTDELELLQRTLEQTAHALHHAGYFGPFGVDAFRWRAPDGSLAFQPRCELNARYSMGWASGFAGT